jgi:hypothetical protein
VSRIVTVILVNFITKETGHVIVCQLIKVGDPTLPSYLQKSAFHFHTYCFCNCTLYVPCLNNGNFTQQQRSLNSIIILYSHLYRHFLQNRFVLK